MDDVTRFAAVALGVGAAVLLAVMSQRLTERVRIPAPAFFLVGAAVVASVWPQLDALTITEVQNAVTVALVLILFDGGLHLGWERLRRNVVGITWLGVAGTFVTAAALAGLAHVLFGFDWVTALLLGTALSPTDPAVVFSVLGRREIVGRSGVLLEGESGANDPVGIALMAALLGAGGLSGAAAIGSVTGTFALQMGVGLVVGVLGGLGLRWLVQHVSLPGEGLYPIRTLAGALAIYGLGTVAQGSGFLAVFVAGIVLGDARAPFRGEIARFHGALASLGEIVAFTLLGLTVHLGTLAQGEAWQIGLVLAVLAAFVVRPLLVGLVLWPVRLARGERVFVLLTGLKGAVPVLLGTFVLAAGRAGALRIYDVIFVVVAFSVVVQGAAVPWLAARCGVPMRTVEPLPWSTGLRFRSEPQALHRVLVGAGSPAVGSTVRDLPLSGDVWIAVLNRDGALVPLADDVRLRAGDEVLLTADPDDPAALAAWFGAPG